MSRLRLDGVYRATRAKIVSEYFLHPVRFFAIGFAIVIGLGVLAYFKPISAQLGLSQRIATVICSVAKVV